MAILIVFGATAFGLPWLSHPLELAILSLAFCLAGAALGGLFGLLCRTERQAGSLALAVSMVLAILGGCWYPASIFPSAMKAVSRIDPAGWAMDGFLSVLSPTSGSGRAMGNAASLAFFALSVLLLTAIISRARRATLA